MVADRSGLFFYQTPAKPALKKRYLSHYSLGFDFFDSDLSVTQKKKA